MRAWFGGYRLTSDFYKGDRAMRESGFDTSDGLVRSLERRTTMRRSCLNSLLYRYERDMAHFAHLLGNPTDAAHWDRLRKSALHGDAALFVAAERRRICRLRFCARKCVGLRIHHFALSPVGRSGHARGSEPGCGEAERVRTAGRAIDQQHQHRDCSGTSPTDGRRRTGSRSRDLRISGSAADAARIAEQFDATVDAGFAADGTIREKYNVVEGNAQVKVSAGYTQNVIGFGWTNAVYLKIKRDCGRSESGKLNRILS